jgi:chromosome segregation ATPase
MKKSALKRMIVNQAFLAVAVDQMIKDLKVGFENKLKLKEAALDNRNLMLKRCILERDTANAEVVDLRAIKKTASGYWENMQRTRRKLTAEIAKSSSLDGHLMSIDEENASNLKLITAAHEKRIDDLTKQLEASRGATDNVASDRGKEVKNLALQNRRLGKRLEFWKKGSENLQARIEKAERRIVNRDFTIESMKQQREMADGSFETYKRDLKLARDERDEAIARIAKSDQKVANLKLSVEYQKGQASHHKVAKEDAWDKITQMEKEEWGK